MLSCAVCGSSFTPPADLLERYPGWAPKSCPSCYRASRAVNNASMQAGPAADARRPARRATANRRAAANLTPEQAREHYNGGPDTGVFTDGSATPNPGPGGWGAVYVVDGQIIAEASGSAPATTNNRMELRALIEGLKLVPEGIPATIYTDSNLAVKTVTEWAAGWEARGWRRKTGPVENLDLVRELYEALRERPELTVRWIKAHAGNRWNEYADRLASGYMRDQP